MWIESHPELRNHPKVTRLSSLLKKHKHEAIAHLHLLWWWCVDYAPDGDLTKFSPQEVASGAEWDGPPSGFWKALIQAGWVDKTEDKHFVVHDWDDFAGKWIRRAKDHAARMKRARLERASHITSTFIAPDQCVPGDLTVPNLTKQSTSTTPVLTHKLSTGKDPEQIGSIIERLGGVR